MLLFLFYDICLYLILYAAVPVYYDRVYFLLSEKYKDLSGHLSLEGV